MTAHHRSHVIRFGIVAASMVAALLAVSALPAAVPQVINYQGRLLDNTPQQNPVDATVTVDFSIWDASTGGASLWSETASVQVVKGLFNVLLGSTTPIPPSVFTAGATRYLEIHVSGETLAPRQRIAATPFATVASSADDAAALGGVGADAYQRRIATPCPAGFSINAVAADGTTTCIQGSPGPAGPPGPPGPGVETGAIAGTLVSCTGPVGVGKLTYLEGRSVSVTAPDGSYLFSYLPAGSYTVDVGTSGDPTAHRVNVSVNSGQTTNMGTVLSNNLQTEPDNCGSCAASCSSNHIARSCQGGSCESGQCVSGWVDCNGSKRTDGCESVEIDNCGTCGSACSTNHIARSCQSGSCEAGVCTSGWADCNNDKRSDGCESSPSSDVNNCGACGHACTGANTTFTCIGGQCNGTCTAPYANCDGDMTNGCERNLSNDVANCGGCNFQCSTNHVPVPSCAQSQCNGACETGYADCDGNKGTNGCETNTNTSNANCGSCGHTCGAGTTCVGGTCS